jgi:hypothetical protein
MVCYAIGNYMLKQPAFILARFFVPELNGYQLVAAVDNIVTLLVFQRINFFKKFTFYTAGIISYRAVTV